MSRRRAIRRDERGVVLVLAALLMIAILVVAALVIDYSLVRDNRQVGRSNSDFAAASGIRSLDNGLGAVQPWPGICEAFDVLVANQPALAGSSVTYATGAGLTIVGNPCNPTTPIGLAAQATLCLANTPATWGVLTATSTDGRFRATIRAGYALPDPAFPEDSAEYAGDSGSASEGGCDHLAVILEETEDAAFGQVAGATDYTTRIRSVARLEISLGGGETAALVLLERTQCPALSLSGTSGAKIVVSGQGSEPGRIHADSDASGSGCNASDTQNGNVIQVNGNPASPVVIARRSTLPIGSESPGKITVTALLTAAGANKSYSPAPSEVCVQVDAADCGFPDHGCGAWIS